METIDTKPEPDKILRLTSVIERTGLRKSSIYAKSKTGEFPAPVKLSQRAIGWPASSIDAWIAGCIEASRQAKEHG